MLKQFIWVWIAYWLAVMLLPVKSLYPATFEAFFVQATFVVLVTVAHAWTVKLADWTRGPAAPIGEIPGSRAVVRAALALSVIGLAAIFYDKVVLQGIDYSEGIAAAREEWRRIAEDREGSASSPLSAVGYLLGSSYFVAVVLALTQRQLFTRAARFVTLVLCFALLITNSAITGGRSTVLLLAATVVATFAVRENLQVRELFNTPLQRIAVVALAVAAVAYSIFVFYERASAANVPPVEYAIEFLPFLGVEAERGFTASLSDGPLDALVAMIVLGISYVTHSFATVAAIVDAPGEDKTILFLHTFGILHKLGLADAPDSDWFLSGRFPSLPGALLHQYGVWGLFLGSLMVGVLSACAVVWSARNPAALLPLGCAVMAGSVLVLSPALLALDFLSFPFVIASFAILAVVAETSTRRRSGRAGGAAGAIRPPASTAETR